MEALVLEAALEASRAGISVMPIRDDGSKKSSVSRWRTFMRSVPNEDLTRMVFDKSSGLAMVCGSVSGGLECMDFDTHEHFDAFVEVCRDAKLAELFERVCAGYREITPRGVHIFYRCPAPKTRKLAQRRHGAQVETLIETRGEGAYAISAPSGGTVHPSGKSYELVSGSVGSIVTITAEEHELLLDAARVLTEMQAEPEEPRAPAMVDDPAGDRPGDEWARLTSWAEILEPHGWVRVQRRGETTLWRRPGKERGVSATTNYAGSDLLYVFSTSTEFDTGRGIGKFSAYTTLEHAGDFSRAASRLRDEGYGTTRPTLELVDLSAFEGARKKAETAAKTTAAKMGGFPEHLFDVPGLIGELWHYAVNSAPKPQPILALGSAIAAGGALFGRRVQTATGVCPNIFIIGLAETGAGKERTRGAVRQALGAVNLAALAAVDDVTSDAAINGFIQDYPSALFMFDEFGHLVREFQDRKGSNISTTLTKLYGLSDGEYWGKTYARDRRTNRRGDDVHVVCPALSIYATSVPHRFWGAIDSEMVVDGFLNRYLILESEDPDPPLRRVVAAAKKPPADLVRMLEPWGSGFDRSVAMNAEQWPDAATYSMSAEAAAELNAFDQAVRERRATARAEGDRVAHDLWARAREQAEKLALIRAAGQGSPEGGSVAKGDARWAVELVTFALEQTQRSVASKLGDSEHDRACKEVLAFLEERGEPVPQSQVTRRFQRMDRRTRESVLQTLVESEQVLNVAVKGKRGRPATAFLHFLHIPSTASGEE